MSTAAAVGVTFAAGGFQASGSEGAVSDRGGGTHDKASLTRYRLAPGVIKNTSSESGLNPTQVHGVLGMPKGKGPHPVVVVLHGMHPNCAPTPDRADDGVAPRAVKTTWPLVCAAEGEEKPGLGQGYLRHNAGLSHVVQALTRKGFAAVSIDVVSAEYWWSGEANPTKGYTQLIDAHLKLLSDLNKGIDHGLDIKGVKGRIDTSRVGLVGHSRGGGYVLGKTAGQRTGLFGAVAIEPAEEAEKPPHRVPVLNIRGACDEDTGPTAGLGTMKDLARSGSTKVAADVRLAGTGHAMLNTNLEPTRKNGSVGDCRASKVAEPDAARDQVAQLTAAFMDQAVHKATAYRLPAVAGPTPTGRNLRQAGPALTFRPAGRHTYTDPQRIPETGSRQRLLPKVPAGLPIDKGGQPDL
ncbi:dienelactone hydrolase family protein [Streptomyces coffeae]|uniref:Alpha/beta hydrolase n=1 Tax=Streptomyces coffeae TaxID=621382 RepID=A0ABS1NGP5_9ACTN|nr:alpha/beta hydrolase [Streptomyces coffeae]MBL1099246.1 alpha/beta hydrolase [Streptomyces coffeae]